jgi:hypothetical protein
LPRQGVEYVAPEAERLNAVTTPHNRCAPLPLVVLGVVFPEMEVDCWRFITH